MVIRILIASCLVALVSATDVTPLQKVVEMLNGMSAKGKKEKHNEEVEFAKFQQYCDSTRAEKEKAIKDGAEQIDGLNADIAKAESDAKVLQSEIEELQKTVAANEAELAAATAIRKKEKADFDATNADYSESIDAIERAITVLRTRSKDVPQSLLQVRSSSLIPTKAKAAIESFLALNSDSEAGAPEANAYEFQSGGVVAMLEKLGQKFKAERLALQKAEMNSRSNFQVLAQKLTDNLERDNDVIGKKTAAKGGRLEDAAQAKSDLAAAEAAKAADEQALSDLNTECTARSIEFEKNQRLRAAEIEAITEAVGILNSDAVKGNAETYLPKFVQQSTAFAQLRSTAQQEPVRAKLESFLQSRAKELGSRYLSLIATRVAADPFKKVKKMIKDMIVKLMEEANSEADHKAFCDTELATNKQTRENKAQEVEELTANVESHDALSAQLAVSIKELSDEVAEIKGQQAEATKLREEEKATNAQTIADAQVAQAAVEKATQVLKDFYAKAAEASLLQGGVQQQMTEAAIYKGMQAESGGIIGFLEVVLSDFARLEAEAASAEDQQSAAYEKFMADANEDVAVKEAEIEHNTNRKQQCDEENASLKKELALTQEELDKSLDVYEGLKKECIDTGLSYEERVEQREAEIKSLQEALGILDQQALTF